jgi:hypothetical protein
MIPLAVDARRRHFPEETPYVYRGSYIGDAVWSEQARADMARDGDEYWVRDITL